MQPNFVKTIQSRMPAITFIVYAGFLIFIHIQLYQYAFDDAFIHFRVARNFVEHGVPYYNLNEIMKVSTSSGWSVFLSGLFWAARLLKMDGNLPLLVSISNAIFTFCTLLIYTEIVETVLQKKLSLKQRTFFRVPFLALLLPASIGLMETPLSLLVAGIGIYLLLRSSPSGFAFLGLAAYLRLELLILLALASLITIFQRRLRVRHVLGFLIGFLPLLIYDLHYYHTLIPNSIVAKSIVYSATSLNSAVYILLLSFPIPAYAYWALTIDGILFLGLLISAGSKALRYNIRLESPWALMFYLWGILVISGYILARAQVFEWYIPIYTIPVFVACFLYFAQNENPQRSFIRNLLYGLFVVSSIFILKTMHAGVSNPGAFNYFAGGSRVKTYLYVGAIMNEEYPRAKLLAPEIGGLGFVFHGKILDAVGLASPDALEFHPMIIPDQRANGEIGAIPPGYVKKYLPELIVSYDYLAQALLCDEIVQQYNVITIPAYLPEDEPYSRSKTIWDSKYLRVYIRKDLPIADKVLALGKLNVLPICTNPVD